MATYVNDLRLKEIATGDESGTWGTSTNTNLELIGEALSYDTEAITTNADTHSTVIADGAADPGRALYLKYTGALDSTCTVTLSPTTVSKIWIIENATTGSQSLTIKQGTGSTVSILASSTKIVYSDGAGAGGKIVDALASLNLETSKIIETSASIQTPLIEYTDGDDAITIADGGGLTFASTVQANGAVTVGVDDTGYDVKFFGATSGNYLLWDESVNSLLVNGDIDMVTNGNRIDLDTDNDTSIRASADDTITVEIGGSDLIALTTTSTFSCPVTVGVDDTGHDVTFFGATTGKKVFWDESADTLYQTCTVDIDGTVTVGVDDTGYDVKFFGDTASAYMLWDTSADDLILAGAARVVVPASGLVIGSTAVSSTAAELNLLDGLDRGSILYGNASSVTTVLGQGSADQVLTSDGTDISWADAAGGVDGLTGLVENNSVWLGADPSGTTSTAQYNVGLGALALDAITTGDENTIVGYGAGSKITTGNQNHGFGSLALFETTTQAANSAFGENALMNNTAANNSAFGAFALDANTTGTSNVAVGYNALTANTTASNNTAVGKDALVAATTGEQNTAVGKEALAALTTAGNDTAVGYFALKANTSGEANAAFGGHTLTLNTSGANNTACGYGALYNNSTASNNTAVGKESLNANTTGTTNTALGSVALYANTTGGQNVGIGSEALDANTTADGNVAIGFRALTANTTGADNVGIGESALEDNTTGTLNTAVGFRALATNITTSNSTGIGYAALENAVGAGNTAVGTYALVTSTTGTRNVAVGANTLDALTTGYNNTSVGYDAGTSTTDAYNNTFIGTYCGDANTTAYSCTAVGHNAMGTEQTGSGNTAVGEGAMYTANSSSNSQNTCFGQSAMGSGALAGTSNTGIGHGALAVLTSATGNSGLGRYSGVAITTGDYNTCVGYIAGDAITTGSNNVCVGYDSGSDAMETITTDSNNVIIGNNSSDNAEVKVDWTVGSDVRDKTDIETLPDNAGLNFVNQMRPVSYVWDNRSNYYSYSHEKYGERDHSKKSKIKQVGFIAQEIKEIEKSIGWEEDHLVNTSNERSYKLMYSQITPILVKAIQELSAEVEELKKKAHNKCDN